MIQKLSELRELPFGKAVTCVGVSGRFLDEETVGHPFVEGPLHLSSLPPETFLQDPPLCNSFNGVFCIRMIRQVAQDLVSDRRNLAFHVNISRSVLDG